MKPRKASSSQTAGSKAKTPTATQRLGTCDIIWPSDSLIDRRDREQLLDERAAAR